MEAGAFYSGATIHLHGLVHPDSAVLVLLVGGTEPEVLNRRERNLDHLGRGGHATVENAPSSHLLTTSGALPAVAHPETREHYRLGIPTLTKSIRIHPARPDADALIRDLDPPARGRVWGARRRVA